MRNLNRTKLDRLYPHRRDPAYQRLLDLESIIAGLAAIRGTGELRRRLQHYVLRLSESFVVYHGASDEEERTSSLEKAVGYARQVDNLLALLARVNAMTRPTYARAVALMAELTAELLDRLCERHGAPRIERTEEIALVIAEALDVAEPDVVIDRDSGGRPAAPGPGFPFRGSS